MTVTFKSNAEATNAIKKVLRQKFPAAKFAVTRGGARIEWEDTGPTVAQVEEVLLAADCVKVRQGWNDQRYVEVPGNSHSNSIWFDRYNVAKREADKAAAERCHEEGEQQRQREREAVHAASIARKAALARPATGTPVLVENEQPAFEVFEQLRQRAEQDVANEDDAERQRRPSWAPALIIEGELLAICIELGLLKPDDKPIARLWAEFADPKRRGTVLREQRSSLSLHGIVCRGFELHAGAERGSTGDILFEAQRDKGGKWRFGPHVSTFDYRSVLTSKWEGKVQELQRAQSGYYNMASEVSAKEIARITGGLAEIEAKDQAAAKAFYRRQYLRNRIVELGRDRVLDFAGAPGVQMALASRLWGHCFNCGKELTDPISLERGIGPDCLHGKIRLAWINHDLKVDVASIAFGIGMPEDFVTATLAAPRPQYRVPLDHFPILEYTDGRCEVRRRDGPGVIGIFANREQAWAWIDAQPKSATLEEEDVRRVRRRDQAPVHQAMSASSEREQAK